MFQKRHLNYKMGTSYELNGFITPISSVFGPQGNQSVRPYEQ